MTTTEVVRDGLISADHPYFHNLPDITEILTCTCGTGASILVMIPWSHRLELCTACYRRLALYLDHNCNIVFVGQAGLA